MQPIFNNPCFHLRPPGKTKLWFGSDRPENYVPEGNLYGPTDIEYKFNKNGFRCDEFDIDSNVRIVFVGCSITEGIGVPYQDGWAYHMIESIRKDTGLEIPYWNLAMGGCGLDAITRAYYHYHDMLKPHIVFGFLPGYRREIFMPDINSNIPVFTTPLDNMLPKYDILLDPRTIHYETEKNLAMLDLMLKKHDTMMIWSGWGYEHYPKNFQHPHDMIIFWDTKGRDSMHPGPDSHQQFANGIYSRFRDQILDKIKSISSFGS